MHFWVITVDKVLDGVYGRFHGFRCLLKSQNKNDKINVPGSPVRSNQT